MVFLWDLGENHITRIPDGVTFCRAAWWLCYWGSALHVYMVYYAWKEAQPSAPGACSCLWREWTQCSPRPLHTFLHGDWNCRLLPSKPATPRIWRFSPHTFGVWMSPVFLEKALFLDFPLEEWFWLVWQRPAHPPKQGSPTDRKSVV